MTWPPIDCSAKVEDYTMIVPLLLLMEGALSLSQLAEEVNNSAFSLMAFWLVSKGEMVAGEHGLIQLLFWLSSTRRAVFIEWLTLERSDSSDCRSCVRGIKPQLSAWWSQSIHSHTQADKHRQTLFERSLKKGSLKDNKQQWQCQCLQQKMPESAHCQALLFSLKALLLFLRRDFYTQL